MLSLSQGYGKVFCLLLIAQLIINLSTFGKIFLVLIWLFSVLNVFLGLLKVGFVFLFFLKFVKKNCLDTLNYYNTNDTFLRNYSKEIC